MHPFGRVDAVNARGQYESGVVNKVCMHEAASGRVTCLWLIASVAGE